MRENRSDQLFRDSGLEVLRQMIHREAGSYRNRPHRAGAAQLVRTALAAGLSPAEINRVSGLGRQTIYNLSRQPASAAAATDLRLQLLALVAARPGLNTADLAAGLSLETDDLKRLIDGLKRSGYLEAADGSWILSSTGRDFLTDAELEQERRRLYPQAWTMYLRIAESEVSLIGAAAERVSGRNGAEVLSASVAPSVMAGPELAIVTEALDQRDALETVQEIYSEIREEAGLQPALAAIALIIEPQQLSPIS